MITRVLVKTGATVRARGMIYKAVAQLVLLYGSNNWLVMGDILNALEEFHYRVDRQITGIMATRGVVGEWEYPLVVTAMEAAGLHPIMEYIRRQHATIAGNVACLPIYELCFKAERMPGMIRMIRWWNQEVVNEP